MDKEVLRMWVKNLYHVIWHPFATGPGQYPLDYYEKGLEIT